MKVELGDSIRSSDIAVLSVTISQIESEKKIESANPDSLGNTPILSTARRQLMNTLYIPTSPKSLIRLPNFFIGNGEFRLTYGIYLKTDKLKKSIEKYEISCTYYQNASKG